jgi:type II secretory pathway component GspD/PulD (secretin)
MKVNIHLRKCLLMGLWVLSGLAASAQNQTVSINVKNATLKNVFSIIEKQTSYRFSFMNNVVSDAKDVSVQCKNATVASLLKKVLPGKHLNYRLVSLLSG